MAEQLHDYYDILGVSKDAAPAEIKQAFHELSKRFHPDSSSSEADEERYKAVTEAHAELGDPVRRKQFDQRWEEQNAVPPDPRDDPAYRAAAKHWGATMPPTQGGQTPPKQSGPKAKPKARPKRPRSQQPPPPRQPRQPPPPPRRPAPESSSAPPPNPGETLSEIYQNWKAYQKSVGRSVDWAIFAQWKAIQERNGRVQPPKFVPKPPPQGQSRPKRRRPASPPPPRSKPTTPPRRSAPKPSSSQTSGADPSKVYREWHAEQRAHGRSTSWQSFLEWKPKPHQKRAQPKTGPRRAPQPLLSLGAANQLTVNYNRTAAQMIEAGRYDYVDQYIFLANFPIQGSGKIVVETVLVTTNQEASSEKIKQAMAEQGLRPARPEELLAFGEKFPQVQREGEVHGLSPLSMRHEHYRSTVCLKGRPGWRYLGLRGFDDRFNDSWRSGTQFLAILK